MFVSVVISQMSLVVESYSALHSDSARMHKMSSYQSRNISFSLAENLGNLLVIGPFLIRALMDSSA